MKSLSKSARALLMCSACLLAIISSTYAWYKAEAYKGSSLIYTKQMLIPSSKVSIENYKGEEDDNGKIKYSAEKLEPGFVIEDLAPGMRRYFRTDITNNSGADSYSSIYLLNVSYSSELLGMLTLQTTWPVSYSSDFSEGAQPSEITNGGKTESIYTAESLCMVERIQIKNGETKSLYWCVELSKSAGNECMDKWIKIQSVQIIGE